MSLQLISPDLYFSGLTFLEIYFISQLIKKISSLYFFPGEIIGDSQKGQIFFTFLNIFFKAYTFESASKIAST